MLNYVQGTVYDILVYWGKYIFRFDLEPLSETKPHLVLSSIFKTPWVEPSGLHPLAILYTGGSLDNTH